MSFSRVSNIARYLLTSDLHISDQLKTVGVTTWNRAYFKRASGH